MGNFGSKDSVPWLLNTDDAACFVRKQATVTFTHFFSECLSFKDNFTSSYK